MPDKFVFGKYQRTNLSFEEVFAGEYDLPLATAPQTVLDIGANEGAFTAWALERWPGCLVDAFEPVPDNAALFLENHKDHDQVNFFQMAVSNEKRLTLHSGLHNSGECSAHDLGEQGPDSVEVECLPPARIAPADFVKVDTEGCELEILTHLDLSRTRAVVFEYHRESDRSQIYSLLGQKGFDLVEHKPRCPDRGVCKFARPGQIIASAPHSGVHIPDDTMLCGNTPGGVTVSLSAGNLRNEFYRPSLKGKKLFIGLPIYSQTATVFMQSLLALQAQKPLPIEIHTGSGDGVARTRNILTTQFLKSDCTHLLFIDCDLIFSAEHIVKLLEANQPIIGGFYPKKQQGPLEWVINTLTPHLPRRPDGLQPVKFIGTGFLCIERSVFERMIEKYPEIKFREDYGRREISYDLWPMGVYHAKPGDEGRYLSEDWYFCQRWLDMGGEIFGHTNVMLRHLGPVIFPLDSQVPEISGPRPRPGATPASDSAPMAESAILAGRRDLPLTILTK
jgi:FkbM family methyltransferase